MGIASAFTYVGIAAILSGLRAAGVFVIATGAAFGWAAHEYLPDVAFERPPSKAIVTRSRVDGMSEQEVFRRLAIHGEREDLKEEKIEKRRKRQERKAKVQGHSGF